LRGFGGVAAGAGARDIPAGLHRWFPWAVLVLAIAEITGAIFLGVHLDASWVVCGVLRFELRIGWGNGCFPTTTSSSGLAVGRFILLRRN
jgi:hypothetical protein